MDDIYDLRSIFLGKDSPVHDLIVSSLEGTPLEESAGSLAFAAGTFAVVNIVFLMLFFSQFAILWIERKAVARMNDRRGATTALRSLWVGENGVTAGEWWNMLPFGAGVPVGAVNRWLNKKFGNRDEKFATVDRVNNRSWMGYSIFPGFFQNVADGMKFLLKEHMVPRRADKLIFEVSPFPHCVFYIAHFGNHSVVKWYLCNQSRPLNSVCNCHFWNCSDRCFLCRLVFKQQVYAHRWYSFSSSIDRLRNPSIAHSIVRCNPFRDIQHHREHSLPACCRFLESFPHASWGSFVPRDNDC